MNDTLIYSKQNLVNLEYIEPKGELYLVYSIENNSEKDFSNQLWDIKKLDNYSGFRNSPKPISVSLTELMKVMVK